MINIILESRRVQDAIRINDDISVSIEQINLKMLQELALEIILEAAKNLQLNGNVFSGELLNSIRILEQGSNSVTVGTDSKHAVFIEFGRGPVFPILGKVLHWVDPDTGNDVFATRAAATEPKPFMQPAIDRKTKKFRDVYVEDVASEINLLVK